MLKFTVVETYADSRLTIQAQLALTAAMHRQQWGRYATMRFCFNQRVDPRLYRLACQLIAGEKIVDYKGILR